MSVTFKRITIDAIVLYDYEIDLTDYTEIYLPNCVEIINSFRHKNNTIKRIIAPELISINCACGFNFSKLESLIVPKIRYLTSLPIAQYFENRHDLNIETTNEFSSSYYIPNHREPKIDKMEIYKNVDTCFTGRTHDNKFYNCTIYNGFCDSVCSYCNIQLSALMKHNNNIFYKCKIPYLGIIVDRNKYVNEVRINALKTSNLYKYFKNTNDEGLTDDEIIDILQSHCKCKDIKNITVKSIDDIIDDEDVIHDLMYLLCDDVLNIIHFHL